MFSASSRKFDLNGEVRTAGTKTKQPDHSASLGDSITSSTQIRFSVHTGHTWTLIHTSVAAETQERLEAVSQRSNLTASNGWHDRHGRDDRKSLSEITFDVVFSSGSDPNWACSTASRWPQHAFDIDGLLYRPKRQPLDSPQLQDQHLSFRGPLVQLRTGRFCLLASVSSSAALQRHLPRPPASSRK